MKKLLSIVCAGVLLIVPLCSCSKDSDNTSVKVPDEASSKVSMTYEEAIEPFKSDETLEKIYDRAETILQHIECIHSYYAGRVYWVEALPGRNEITNENGTDDSMNALDEYFESEAQYTDYIKTISNPVIKDSYLKFINLAKEIYQKFVDNPTKSVVEELEPDITALGLYLSNTNINSSTDKAEYYLSAYTSAVYDNLAFIEAYCMLTPEEIEKVSKSDQSTPYEDRMINVMGRLGNVFADSVEGIDLDYVISTLDSLMLLKDNAEAMAVEAYGLDSQNLAQYEKFIKLTANLYNTVRVHRPEFNDTEYIEKQEFDLDVLEKYADSY